MLKAEKPFVAFRPQTMKYLERALAEVQELSNITWEFTTDYNQRDVLVVSGLGMQEVTFSSDRAALAFLDGYLLGHKHGLSDGVE